MFVIGTLPDAQTESMSVARLRELCAEVLGARMATELTQPDGTKVPITVEALTATTVVQEENGRAIGVRANYELAYKESRVAQQGAMQMTASQFRSYLTYELGHQAKGLFSYQPGLNWQIVGALVDPVRVNRPAVRLAPAYEPTPEEVQIRMAAALPRPAGVGGNGAEPVHRYSRLVEEKYDSSEWRWYFRIVWGNPDGSGDLSDPAERSGGLPTGLKQYAETRQLRHMPRGSKRNRDQAIELLQRIGTEQVVVAPAMTLTPEQRATAAQLVKEGANVALVAKMLGVSPEDVAAGMPVQATREVPTARRGTTR